MSITHKQRQTLCDNLYWFFEHSTLWQYEQLRPFPIRIKADIQELFNRGEQVTGYDCSASSVEAFYISGLKDPTGYGFKGYGNTSNILEFLKGHYTSPEKALPGALAVFNANLALSEQHVAIVGDEGSGTKNPIMFTHGGPGFQRMRLEDLQAGFAGQTVFCSPGPLG